MNGASGQLAASSTDIFGRDAEFLRISEFLEALPRGPRALLLEGEPGVGKTTVWRWALERAAAIPYRVLACRPAEVEAKFSYAAMADVLAGVEEQVLDGLPEPQRRALQVALLRESGEGQALDPRVVAAAVATSFRIVAKSGPALLAIDDAQWLDAPSRRVLEFAIRRLEVEPFGILVAQRSRDDGAAALGVDRALGPDGFSRLELPPLSLGALHHMLRARLGAELPRSVLVQLHAASGGNPFYALEIARDLMTREAQPGRGVMPVPRSLRDLVEGRLARLPRRTQDLLLTVAALAHPTLALVTAAAEHPDRLGEDLDRACGAGVVELAGDRIRFTHPLLATVHYAVAPDSRRRALHSRLAGAVSDVEERARHLALAATGADEATAQILDAAAARARGRGAPEAAATLLEEARWLTPADRPDATWRRMSEAAMCHYLAGNTERARELWEEIEASAPAGVARAAALWHLSEFRHSTLDLPRQLAAAERALAEAGNDVALKSAIHHTLALTLAWNGDVRGAGPHADAAQELAETQTDPAVIAMAGTAAFFVKYLAGEGLPSDLTERTLALEPATRHLPVENSPRMYRAMIWSWLGENLNVPRRDLTDLCREAQDTGRDISLPLLYFLMSNLECRAGDLELADRHATASLEAAGRTEQLFRMPLGLLARATVQSRRGDLVAAQATATEGLALNRRAGTRYAEALFWGLLGFIELSRGDPAAASGWLIRVVELEESGGYADPTAFRARHDAIEALIELGQLEAAGSLVDTLEQRGRHLEGAWAEATGARCHGLLAAAGGDLDAAQAAIERALQAHERLADPFELGRSLLVLGNLQRRSRKKRAARDSLRRALETFRAMGAAGWAARAEAEMHRLGLQTSGPDELSATEERVARLVAAGHTNREIASTLFVSVKAVEANLTRIYTKLGVRSRTELALRLSSPKL